MAVALSYPILEEPFLWSHLMGGACVLLAIALIARHGSEATEAAPASRERHQGGQGQRCHPADSAWYRSARDEKAG